MNDAEEDVFAKRIRELEKELDALRLQQHARRDRSDQKKSSSCNLPLELEEYVRYGRQMIIPQIGLPGQLALKKSSVLVIGAGGLGCPVLLYLVAAGIGKVGIADQDHVDLSNLHRQVLHRTSAVGDLKTRSAERSLRQFGPRKLYILMLRLNPNVEIECHDTGITAQNAISIIEQYDVVVDCTDAPSTRYLISDATVVLSKPLVSGSALGTEGQITVYGYRGGPCYRCVFPNPPPAESVLTCGEGGILGPVVGVIGVMQALETIKVILHSITPNTEGATYHPSMTIFSAFDSPQWRTFKLRLRKLDCISCGNSPSITANTIRNNDYATLCQRTMPPEIIDRISVKEYSYLGDRDHVLIDIRDSTQFGICSLPNSKNIPYTDLMDDAASNLSSIPRDQPVFVICRFGNDSQVAVEMMKKMEHRFPNVRDIRGGLDAWAETYPMDIIPKY